MKNQLIIILEALRLTRAALGRNRQPDGPNAESTIRELHQLLENESVGAAIEFLDPQVKSPDIATKDGIRPAYYH
jgi:hypothetical protein